MAEVNPAFVFADARIFHARLRPHGLNFQYSMLVIYVDIDQADDARHTTLFSIGGIRFLGFSRHDHGPRDGSPLRPYIDRLHHEAGLVRPAGVMLVCFPRILGFVFNPIATYVGTDAKGRATSVVYEVRNTFGEHHTYLLPLAEAEDGNIAAHETDKLFYVSPFMDMPMRYRFRLSPPRGGAFALKIIERDRQDVVLTALIQARAFEATTAALVSRLLRTPLLGLKVLAAIHWQALRLWLRGHRIRPRPNPPHPVSCHEPGEFTLSANAPEPGERHA